MEPKQTLWNLEAHTRGKHLVLRSYLNAWLPIMGTKNRRILFVDGFAGPGKYEGEEEGSPLIALNAFKEHNARGLITAEVRYIFIEKDPNRFDHLDSLVKDLRSTLPNNCHVDVIKGMFDETMIEVLDEIEAQERRLAPSFVMVDPFGVSGTPMTVLERIFRNPKSEVYVSLMYESINRFKNTSEFPSHLDSLFGTNKWTRGVDIQDPENRKNFFYDLYEGQLRRAGAGHVVHFDLYESRRLVYGIFFGTKHWKGADIMKQAIWKVAPFGDFAFIGTKSQQLKFGIAPNLDPLKEILSSHFRGKGWINIDDILQYVASDRTDYHTGQVKRDTLYPMEGDGRIEIKQGTRKRKGTYPEGTQLRFI